MNNLLYEPPPSVVPFFTSDAFISLICGPIGSTKTTSAIIKIAFHAKRMAACRDGVRRSRCIVVRNTREILMDSTIPDFLKWFPDGQAGSFLKTERRFILRFDDVECEVLFRGLDDANDVRRLLSLQASFGLLDEFREINPSIFEALQGRLGRYPDGMMVPHRPEWGLNEKGEPIQGCVTDTGESNAHLWGATNPPEYDSWWQKLMDDPATNMKVVFQPSGTSPDADWTQHLPSDYYDNLAKGKTADWINVYVHGLYGRSLSGMPVFPTFNRGFHVAKTELKPLRFADRPIIIGMDFGLTPACTINQIDARGRMLTYQSITSEGMGITRFVPTKLAPVLAQRFAGIPVLIVGDPAGNHRSETDEKSCFDILKTMGFRCVGARTNNIVARIGAVERLLARQIDGGPGWLIDPIYCVELIRALAGGYCYKLKKSGEAEATPDKSSKHSHIMDAGEYAALHSEAPGMLGVIGGGAPRREIAVADAGGWT